MVEHVNASISNIEFYLPSVDYSNKNLTSKTKDEIAIKSIIDKVGIDKKFAAEEKEFSTDLGLNAAKKFLKKNQN